MPTNDMKRNKDMNATADRPRQAVRDRILPDDELEPEEDFHAHVGTTSTNAIVFSPSGRVDAQASPVLEEQLAELISDGSTRIIVDLSQVEYISSAGLRVFVKAGRQLPPEGRMVACGMNKSVRNVLRLAGFHHIMTIVEDFDTAEKHVDE